MGDMGSLLQLPQQIAHAVGEILGTFSLGAVAPKLSAVTAPVEGFVKSFVGAITKILDPFKQLTEVASSFVQHFSPADVEDLSRRQKDLFATLGVAMKPIIDVARDVVKSLADNLLPVMKKLEPIVREMAESVGGVLQDSFDELGQFLDDLMPLFDEMKEFVVGIVPAMKELGIVVKVLGAAAMQLGKDLVGMIGGEGGGGVKSAMEQLQNVVHKAVEALVHFAARMFALVGWTKGLEAMQKAFQPNKHEKEDSTGMAIASGAMFKSIADLGKSVEQAAFAASAAGGKVTKPAAEQQVDLMAKMLEATKVGQAEATKDREWIRQKVQLVETVLTDIGVTVGKVKTGVDDFVKEAQRLEGKYQEGKRRVEKAAHVGEGIIKGILWPFQ